jgi:hypothetical protein
MIQQHTFLFRDHGLDGRPTLLLNILENSPSRMMGKSKVVLKIFFYSNCNKAEYKIMIITYLCLITKAAKR